MDDTELSNLLTNLCWLRRQHGLSKREMCRRLKISMTTLNKIEEGLFPPQLRADVLFFGVGRIWCASNRHAEEKIEERSLKLRYLKNICSCSR